MELALKRTDYIVIDDREASNQKPLKNGGGKPSPLKLDDNLKENPPADLKPLSTSEVETLGVNAASFVMSSDDPFDTLLKLSQDFPKHSAAIAARNATPEYLEELRSNRALLPSNRNAMWINGLQMDAQHVDAFSLLAHLRHERRLIGSFRELGLTAREAVDLLSNPAVAQSRVSEEVTRYDYRDDIEGGGIIIWINDLETGRLYKDWPRSVRAVRF